MKPILIFLLIAISILSFSQKKLTEEEVIKNERIDLTKEVIMFKISGLIEIDRHTFLNDTCKNPIMYYSNLKEVIIKRKKTGERYLYKKCSEKGCKVIHLEEDLEFEIRGI